MKCTQFVGAACGHHGPYVFYKAVKIFKHGKFKILGLGEFFFIRISPSEDPCIGELQLLWEDKTSEQMLSSVRLYFLPEQTPEGRKSHHGEHEVVAAAEKVVLRLEDLRTWMIEEVSWCHGLVAPWSRQVREAPEDGPLSAKAHALGSQHLDALKDTKDLAGAFLDRHNLDLEREKACLEDGDLVSECHREGEGGCRSSTCVLVLSYPRYCRYRSVLKRLNGLQNAWLKNTLVVALGGFALPCTNGRVLFCRDTFEHDGLLHNDLNCEHLAPTLKGKPRIKKRVKGQGRSQSPGSESNASEDSKETSLKAQVTLYEANNGKKPCCKEEQEFLQKLFKFMQERHTPIHRVPHLGFKQIDLYLFFSCAQKLGGYDAITCKKMWKQVYDEMGGNPGSTSAATCTRRHYERLLLPYERYSNGEEDRPTVNAPVPQIVPTKGTVPQEAGAVVLERQDSAESCKTEEEDVKPESPLEAEEGDCAPAEADLLPLRPPVTPILVDLEAETRNETITNNQTVGQKKRIRDTAISEKERKWNEIRRKTAMARNWARQLRPVKPGTSELELDMKTSDPNVHPMVADYGKAPPGGVYPVAFHPAYSNNKHSSLPAMSSPKPPMGHPPVRDHISCSSHQPYQTAPPPPHHLHHHLHHHHHHHHASASKSHQSDGSDSLSNGYPPSKDGMYQRRPSVIQHTEKIRSPPLPNQPMPAHLGSQSAEGAHLRTDSANRVMFHPGYDGRIRPQDRVPEINIKEELTGANLIARKPSTPMYVQAQQQRRHYYSSINKEKIQASPGVRPVLDLASKRQSPSSFPTALAPSTPLYCRGSLRVQDGSPCEAEVLDLSVKSKKDSCTLQNRLSVTVPEKKVSLSYSNEECLDLSVKKRKTGAVDLSDEARGIENVTPPSPVGRSLGDEDRVMLMPPMKTPITSLSLLRSATADKVQLPQRDVGNSTPPAFLPVVDAKPAFLVEDVQATAQHAPGKPLFVSDYNPSLPPFLSPSPVYPPATSTWTQNQQSGVDGLQNNIPGYKELVDHGVFSGPFPYSLAQRLYPLLYKDGNGFPTFSK